MSAISSGRDDLAFIKFCYISPVPGVAGEDAALLPFCMLKSVWNFNTFDWFLLVCWGLFEDVNGLSLYTVAASVCFLWLLISGAKKYLQNECHLAAKFGTKIAALY